MEHSRLSSRLIFDKTIIILICFVVLPLLFYNYPGTRVICFFAIPILAFFAYFFFYLPDNVKFDEEYIYVTSKGKNYKVDFKDINLIKITGFRIGYRYFGIIKYMVNTEEKTARFFSRYFSIYMNDFCKLVKATKPNVSIDRPWWLT